MWCIPQSPSHIARIFHEVMEELEFKNKYKLLLFAILDDHNVRLKHNPDGNYLPLLKKFTNRKQED